MAHQSEWVTQDPSSLNQASTLTTTSGGKWGRGMGERGGGWGQMGENGGGMDCGLWRDVVEENGTKMGEKREGNGTKYPFSTVPFGHLSGGRRSCPQSPLQTSAHFTHRRKNGHVCHPKTLTARAASADACFMGHPPTPGPRPSHAPPNPPQRCGLPTSPPPGGGVPRHLRLPSPTQPSGPGHYRAMHRMQQVPTEAWMWVGRVLLGGTQHRADS